VKLSTLWVVAMLNMIFADILSFMPPGALAGPPTGDAEGIRIAQGILLAFAALLEIPIAMIFPSRVLSREANTPANVLASAVTIAFVVGCGSSSLHYLFFAAIEFACMLVIAWRSLKWPKPAVKEKWSNPAAELRGMNPPANQGVST
jgi:hypothetical protein